MIRINYPAPVNTTAAMFGHNEGVYGPSPSIPVPAYLTDTLKRHLIKDQIKISDPTATSPQLAAKMKDVPSSARNKPSDKSKIIRNSQ